MVSFIKPLGNVNGDTSCRAQLTETLVLVLKILRCNLYISPQFVKEIIKVLIKYLNLQIKVLEPVLLLVN